MTTNHQLIVFSLYISFIPILVDSISFNFPRFPEPSIVHQGDATNVSTGAIEFNKVDRSCRVGLITYVDEVHLWDKGSGKVSDFSTHFSFSIDTLNKSSGEYGHGLTFFIAPSDVQIPPNSNGGYLGLFNTSTAYAEDNQMIVVEFDSFSDDEWDPPYEHVGINKGTVESNNYTRWNASEHSGDVADVWVTYNASAKNLMVVWSYRNDANTRANSSVSLGIDLKEAIPDTVSIGFSAATDQFVERNSLQSWEFNSNLKKYVWRCITRARKESWVIAISYGPKRQAHYVFKQELGKEGKDFKLKELQITVNMEEIVITSIPQTSSLESYK